MRFHRPIDDVLGNGVRLAILRTLVAPPPRGWTGRALAQEIDASPTQTGRALGALEGVGLVRREAAGRAFLWKLVPDHVLVPPLTQLFTEEGRALETLTSELGRALTKLPVGRAWLFGSVSRGDERPTSDVDILLEVRSADAKERVEEHLSLFATQFMVRFGNPLSTLVVQTSQRRSGVDPELLRDVRADGIPLQVSP
jgi:predicted nucleotidyltransferase